jgi:hypothetical protein
MGMGPFFSPLTAEPVGWVCPLITHAPSVSVQHYSTVVRFSIGLLVCSDQPSLDGNFDSPGILGVLRNGVQSSPRTGGIVSGLGYDVLDTG